MTIDFYNTKEECTKNKHISYNTNKRYKSFNQSIFTAGDEDQFHTHRCKQNGTPFVYSEADYMHNFFFKLYKQPGCVDDIYSNIQSDSVTNTFRYIFHKFKKGIFVKIVNGSLRVFLPFSKSSFTNEWSGCIQFDPVKYKSFTDFFKYICSQTNHSFNPHHINKDVRSWYGNNCLVRYEYPVHEGDTNTNTIKNMIEELCAERKIPDIEFFINKRDFPILTYDKTEPYTHIWGVDKELVSHAYDKYIPIISMSKTSSYADVLFPTYDDWSRVQRHSDKWFVDSASKQFEHIQETKWEDKKQTAVFRGGSTGAGVNVHTNMRLKLAYMSYISKLDDPIPYIDAGITKWNVRPRKVHDDAYLRTIDIQTLPFKRVGTLSYQEQSTYKYIINVDGHVSAFRLSFELSMKSTLLLVKSEWTMWFSHLLKPYVHYIPVKSDLSDLIDQIKWCRLHDNECKQIAYNAYAFYTRYLNRSSILDFMQYTLVTLKRSMGEYRYPIHTPLYTSIAYECKHIKYIYPCVHGCVFVKFPEYNTRTHHEYNYVKGVEMIIHYLIDTRQVVPCLTNKQFIFKNNTCDVHAYTIKNRRFVIKQTQCIHKIKEHIHESFITNRQLNKLRKYIPNFLYVYACFRTHNNCNVISEYIEGITLFDYLKSDSFAFNDFLFIVIQICLSLSVAQHTCGFVHYDLTPWNVMLKKRNKPITYDYTIDTDTVIRTRTSIIPILIDFGKSHVYNNGRHHGFINMFTFSTIHDTLSLLMNSLQIIIKHQRLSRCEINHIIYLSNFISKTKYCTSSFKSLHGIRTFFEKASKYSNIIHDNKYELEQKTPYDLVQYIMKLRNIYVLPMGTVNKYTHMETKLPIYITHFQVFHESFDVNHTLKTYSHILKHISTFSFIPSHVYNEKIPILNAFAHFCTCIKQYCIHNHVYTDLIKQSCVGAANNLHSLYTDVDKTTHVHVRTCMPFDEYIYDNTIALNDLMLNVQTRVVPVISTDAYHVNHNTLTFFMEQNEIKKVSVL